MFFITALIVTLVVGDFGSTFFYHVPQHLWFTLHLRTHHDRRRPYFDHAVLSTDPAVLWRHTTELGWRTPGRARALLRPLGIVLPEDHDGHHRNPEVEFGDIFRFYDAPARALLAWLAPTGRRARNAGRRTTRRVPARA